MKKTTQVIFLSIYLLFFSFVFTKNTLALTVNLTQPPGLGVNINAGNSVESLVETIVVNVINIFFTVGGIGVVIYFVWGAVDWILSGGDKEKVANARKKMTHALIGLALLSLSFVIINILGQVLGFNPLGYLQIRGLGTNSTVNPIPNQSFSGPGSQ